MSELMMLKCLTGLSQFILTGRSTDFEIYALDNEEQGAVIKLPASSDQTYKFGLVNRVIERSGKKEYLTEVFSVGQLEQETEIKVEVEELVQQPLALVKRVEVDGEAEVVMFIIPKI